jgi:hypothetical protein
VSTQSLPTVISLENVITLLEKAKSFNSDLRAKSESALCPPPPRSA